MIPVAIARALTIARAHPSVTDVRVCCHTEEGIVVAECDFGTELPSSWRKAGESPSGVRETEIVTFRFDRNFPIRAPQIALRADFNRSHPHINPGSPDEPPEPCIVAGSPAELIQARGFDGYVDQIADWLDKAALFELNSERHGWEPVRRDRLDDFMVVDGHSLRALANPKGNCIIVPTKFVLISFRNTEFYLIDHRSAQSIELGQATFGRHLVNGGLWRGAAIGLVVWASDVNPGESFVVKEYMPETVTTIRSLRDRAQIYGCRDELDSKLNQIAIGLSGKSFEPTPLTITFLVRRPFAVIGTDSDIELCVYLINIKSFEDLVDENRSVVRFCGIREQLSVPVLRRVSGLMDINIQKAWTLLGCGSVGSKIAVSMARRGMGPNIVVDNGAMSPHNYARHALFPTELVERGVVDRKAILLADSLTQLKQAPTVVDSDILSLCGNIEDQKRIFLANTCMVLNTTASTVVRETLSFQSLEPRPQIGEAHLLGAGRVGYAAFEGAGGNPNLSDLAAESYRLFAGNNALNRVVFGAEAEVVTIGQGCSAVTFPMPDDQLNMLAGALTTTVAKRLTSPSAEGEIIIGSLRDDGLSQDWISQRVRPWIVLRSETSLFSIRISPSVDRVIRNEIAARPDTETGGVIVGRFSQIGNSFQVVDLISAPVDSIFSPEKFVLGTAGLKAKIRALNETSGGTLYVLGTWHNHLIKSGPSLLDAETGALLALRQYFPALMLIALPEGYTFLIAERSMRA